jgi:hypothetical protein
VTLCLSVTVRVRLGPLVLVPAGRAEVDPPSRQAHLVRVRVMVMVRVRVRVRVGVRVRFRVRVRVVK